MYTADMARQGLQQDHDELDRRIEKAVREDSRWGNRSSIRVYCDDPFRHTIREELEKRGFRVTCVPEITIKGDVDFEW